MDLNMLECEGPEVYFGRMCRRQRPVLMPPASGGLLKPQGRDGLSWEQTGVPRRGLWQCGQPMVRVASAPGMVAV